MSPGPIEEELSALSIYHETAAVQQTWLRMYHHIQSHHPGLMLFCWHQ